MRACKIPIVFFLIGLITTSPTSEWARYRALRSRGQSTWRKRGCVLFPSRPCFPLYIAHLPRLLASQTGAIYRGPYSSRNGHLFVFVVGPTEKEDGSNKSARLACGRQRDRCPRHPFFVSWRFFFVFKKSLSRNLIPGLFSV